MLLSWIVITKQLESPDPIFEFTKPTPIEPGYYQSGGAILESFQDLEAKIELEEAEITGIRFVDINY